MAVFSWAELKIVFSTSQLSFFQMSNWCTRLAYISWVLIITLFSASFSLIIKISTKQIKIFISAQIIEHYLFIYYDTRKFEIGIQKNWLKAVLNSICFCVDILSILVCTINRCMWKLIGLIQYNNSLAFFIPFCLFWAITEAIAL